MATVRQVLRKNLEEAVYFLANFNWDAGKVKVKALGNDLYKVWTTKSTWEKEVSKEDVFDGDLMENMIRELIESFDTLEPDIVNEQWGSYHDYSFVAGEDSGFLGESVKEIDCRMHNYDEGELDIFWAFDAVDFIPEQLKEIIQDAPIVVYHRKGKDWRVSPLVESFDCEVFYLDEDDRSMEYWTQMEGKMLHNIEDFSEEVSACVNFIQGCKDDLELKCIARKLIKKAEAMNPFITNAFNEDVLIDNAFNFCSEFYQSNNTGTGWNTGFNGDFPDITDKETFEDFLITFEDFKHQPEMALKDSMKLYRLGEKIGFEASFDFSSDDSVSVEFLVEEAYSVHVSGEEFECHNYDWMKVYREEVLPQVQRRKIIAQMDAVKAKVGSNIKQVARKLWVGFNDSLQAGNCYFGSNEFIKRHHISLEKLGAIRGDWLLEMEDTDFTRRIILSLAAQKPEVLEA